jgi:hypothetical protein
MGALLKGISGDTLNIRASLLNKHYLSSYLRKEQILLLVPFVQLLLNS